MNRPLNKHQYEQSSVFTTSKSRMAGVLKLSYLPTNAASEKFDLSRINDIWKKNYDVQMQWKNSLRMDCELANTYVYIV